MRILEYRDLDAAAVRPQYEKVRRLLEQSPGCLFLCQYGLGEFSGRETMMAIEAHRPHHQISRRGFTPPRRSLRHLQASRDRIAFGTAGA